MTAWDEKVFLLINGHWVNGFLDWFMPFITDFDHWRVPVILILLVVLARGKTDTRLAILFAIVAVVLADQLSSGTLKPLFHRERPFHVIEAARVLNGAHGWSFPSSHAANTFAAGTFLALRFRRLAWILVLPVLISYSRVYVGVHYPLDVLAGAALGAGVGGLCAVIERVARRRLGGWMSRRHRRKDVPPDDQAPGDAAA